MATAFLGIGANVGDRRGNCERAVTLLKAHPAIQIVATAPWREYPALTHRPDEVQPPYLNGAIRIGTTLDPESLLTICQDVERRLGRDRASARRWAPRTIDLDILFYDDLVVTTPTLTIPHPELVKRLFVLEPLSMLAPDWVHPVEHKTIQEIAHAILHR